jgi:hypothetical protein
MTKLKQNTSSRRAISRRKLQPARQVFSRYFRYEQREADIVLEALVRKTGQWWTS